MKVREIPLEKLFTTKNVRFDTDEELGELIESTQHYLLQPIGVYPRGERYEIVFGHRRFRAAQMNNDRTIACHILEDISESDIPLIKLQENMVRKQLTNEEILAAADEIRRKKPSLTDRQIDVLLGKKPGWLGWRRSLVNAYDYLAAEGLSRTKINALSGEEVMELRARMENPEAPSRVSKGSFHRREVPKTGFRVINSPGPNLVLVCASSDVKIRIHARLRRLAKEMA
jgi:ParB family chromosome partitioning protein